MAAHSRRHLRLPRSVVEAEARYAAAGGRRARHVWSISVLEGDSLVSLGPVAGRVHPALSAAQVSDVRAGFVADPFRIERDGRQFMFFEIHDLQRNKGCIGLATSDNGLAWTYERSVLTEPCHLSYPCVFEHAGRACMIPETHERSEVALYEADDFPFGWRRAATLITGRPFVDPTPFFHEGCWYLFAGEAYRGVLHLFVANALTGPWQAHPASPVVKVDARHARPGGRVVHDGESWIRIAQSTEPIYGAFLSAFRIRRLSPLEYAEQPISPYPLLAAAGDGWWAHGIHHLDAWRGADGRWRAIADGLQLLP